MALRRMLNTNMINSDEFSELSHAAQLLYIHLNMTADDDGLVGNPTKLMRSLLIRKQHLDTLVENGYVIRFDSGVVAVRHWHQHNYIRSDRYIKTRYITELSQLKLGADSSYEILDFTEETGTFGQPSDVSSQAQCSIGKDSIVKDSIVKCSVEEKREDSPQKTNNTTYKNNEEDIFDFEKIECNNPNVFALAQFSLSQGQASSIYTDTLTSEQKKKYESFLYNLNAYVILNKIKLDTPAFVRFNEERGWIGRGGERVIKNYKKYVDAWVNKDFGLKKS